MNDLWEGESPRRFAAPPFDKGGLWREGDIRGATRPAFQESTLIRLAALGTFPLEGGRLLGGHTGPPLRADRNISERAGEGTRPYGSKRTGSVGSAESGAVVEPQQRQFLHTKGPVARREFRSSLRFCAPEILCQAAGITPVLGSGESGLWA